MIPPKRGPVDLSERETATLVGVLDVGKVVVEVVEGVVAAGGFLSHGYSRSFANAGRRAE